VLKRVHFIFWLDVLLFLTLCSLEVVRLTGLTLHEWFGIALVFGILLHLLLAWTWISDGTRQLAKPRSKRIRINYALNFVLFAMITIVIYSGVLISEVAGPSMGLVATTDPRWRSVHDFFSQTMVVIAGLHLAINWDYSVAMGRKCLGFQKG
jgi:cytochrome b561